MMSFLLWMEEEECVTSYSGRSESFACTINSTSGWVVASVWVKVQVKVAAKQSSWGLMGWIKNLTERLCSLLRLIALSSSSHQEGSRTVPV